MASCHRCGQEIQHPGEHTEAVCLAVVKKREGILKTALEHKNKAINDLEIKVISLQACVLSHQKTIETLKVDLDDYRKGFEGAMLLIDAMTDMRKRLTNLTREKITIADALLMIIDRLNARILKLQQRRDKWRKQPEWLCLLRKQYDECDKKLQVFLKNYRDKQEEHKKVREISANTKRQTFQDLLAARKRIAELEQANRWIPVAERLPSDGQKVLFYWANDMHTGTYDVTFQDFYTHTSTYSVEKVTHWRPLPAPPEGEN